MEIEGENAATGDGACALLKRHPMAAIVLDAILGEEHGLDLVQRFGALSAAPILLLTGHGSEDLATRALRARVSDYLKKPVSLAELRGALARVRTTHRGIEQIAQTVGYARVTTNATLLVRTNAPLTAQDHSDQFPSSQRIAAPLRP
jgi:two-component system, OmpR family, response regulator TctD